MPVQKRIKPDARARIDLKKAKVTVLINAGSGKKDGEGRLETIRERVSPVAGELDLQCVRRGSDIARLARKSVKTGSDVVAVFGGDGSQSAVAEALTGSRAAMAVLPGGTFNYFARELGVETLDTALDALVAGAVQHRHIGIINERIFLNNASIGLYPHILASREAIYRRWGRSRVAAYWSVLDGLAGLRRPMRLRVLADENERHFTTPLAFVARSAYQLESLGLDGAEAVRAGRLALFVAKGTSRRALVASSLRLAMGRMARDEDFELVLADELVIESDRPRRLVALDGEKERMATPLRLAVRHGGLRVIVPDAEMAGTGDRSTA